MILVTGPTGHIGNILVRRLAEHYPNEAIRLLLQPGQTLDMFDSLTLELIYGDIRKKTDVDRAVRGARLVFHLAGIIDTAPRNPQLLQDVNVQGTRLLVDACLKHHVQRLLYVSSVHALPDLPDDQTIREIDDFPVPDLLGPYAQSKSDATAMVYDGIAQDLDAVVVYPSGIIGPYDYQQSQMGRLIKYLSSQGWLKLVMSFDGAYNFVDVRDVVEGIIAAMDRGRAGQGYILSGHRVTMREVIRLEREALGQKQPVIFFAPVWVVKIGAFITHWATRLLHIKPIFTPYSIDVLQSNSNISHDKATRELGYQPRPLLDTFRDSLTWMMAAGMIPKSRSSRRSSPRHPADPN